MGIEVGHPVGAQELHGCGRKPLYTKEMSVLELNSPSNISTSVSPSLPQDLIILGNRNLTLLNTSV